MVGARTTRAILLATALVGVVTPARAADADGLVIETQPSTVSFDGREQARVLAIVRNEGERKLSDVRLGWLDDAVVEVVTGALEPVASLSPGAAHAWVLTLTPPAQPPSSGKLLLRVDYDERRSSQTTVTRVATVEIEVTHPEYGSADDVVDITVESSLESLNEHRPGQIYLLVTNKLDRPLEIHEPVVLSPSFVELSAPTVAGPGSPSGRAGGPDGPSVVAPKGTEVLRLDVRARSRIQPGSHMLVFQVPMRWDDGRGERSMRQVVTKSIEVGVLGESAVLKLLGIPSVLVLPGFLFVSTLLFSRKFSAFVRSAEHEPLVTAKSSEFWLLSITGSIVLFAINRLAGGHDYLTTYGLADLVRLWLLSIVLAVAIALGVVAWVRARRILRGRREFGPTDDPTTVLRKLARQNMSVRLPRHRVTIGGEEHSAFLLQPNDPGRPETWVAPGILYVRVTGAKVEASRHLSGQIEERLDEGKGTEAIADLLERGRRRALVDVRWDVSGELGGPRRIPTDDVGGLQGESTLVRSG